MDSKKLNYANYWIYQKALHIYRNDDFAKAFAERYARPMCELLPDNYAEYGDGYREKLLAQVILEDFNR